MVRVGVAGVRRGSSFCNVFHHRPDCELTAICDLNEAALDTMGERLGVANRCTDFGAMLDCDLDVVVIATPPATHCEYAIQALDAGKHVLAEVPAVQTLDEAQRLADAVRHSGKKYMMAENVCFFPAIQTIKRLYDDGRLGRVMYAEAEYIHDIRSLRQAADGSPTWRSTYPPLMYPTHSAGPIIHVLQTRFTHATAMQSAAVLEDRFDTPDVQSGLFQMANGGVAKIMCFFAVIRPANHYFSFYGDKGCYERARCGWDKDKGWFLDIPNQTDMIPMQTSFSNHTGIHGVGLPAYATMGGHGTGEHFMIEGFLDAIRTGGPEPIDVFESLDYSVPGICAQESIRTGRTVEIPDFRR